MASILVIEDEAVLARSFARALEDRGHRVATEESGAGGVARVREGSPDLVLLDLRLPDAWGLDVLSEILSIDASLPVILMTAYGTVQDAVEAMRLGARDYLQKPLDLDELRLQVDRVLETERRARELTYHRERAVAGPGGVIGSDPRLLAVFEQVRRLAEAGLAPGERPTILLTGETGTGKGLMARALHELLGGGPFIEVNCTAMPTALVEAELFGHEKGTFTDARAPRTGLFEAAEGGAVFLDEIGSLELPLQAKFLKVIEEKRVRRLGSNQERSVDVHVVAATNRDLAEAVREGEFREDLLHRLSVLSFELPPLRERLGDLQELATHFSREIGLRYGRERRLAADARRLLERYDWPGNVRELRNVIERAVLVDPSEELGVEAFAGLGTGSPRAASSLTALPPEGISLVELERDLIRQALERSEGNRTQAAKLLGLTRDTLRYRIEKFDLG